MSAQTLVAIVDNDESVRESLPYLIRVLGFSIKVFCSAEDFLAQCDKTSTGCLVLDICLPGLSGLETLRLARIRMSS